MPASGERAFDGRPQTRNRAIEPHARASHLRSGCPIEPMREFDQTSLLLAQAHARIARGEPSLERDQVRRARTRAIEGARAHAVAQLVELLPPLAEKRSGTREERV